MLRSFDRHFPSHPLPDQWLRGRCVRQQARASPNYDEAAHGLLRKHAGSPHVDDWSRRAVVGRSRRPARSGCERAFALLKPCLYRDTDAQSYASIALELRKSQDSIKTGLHRLRQRFQPYLRAQLIETVVEPDQVEEELSHLRQILQR